MFTTGDMTGLLLVGHGTRDRIGRSEFFQVCELVAQRVEIPVRPCFLELADPTIEQAVEELLAYGVNRILVVPLLLFAAGHVKRDIPTAVQAAVRGRVQIQQAAQLGCHPSLVQLSAIRFREAADRLKYPPSCTVSVLVGRGSRDPSATADMARFVGLRQEFVEARRTLHGFIAMASPSIEEVLQHTGNNTSSPIIVQPHLLFHGELSMQTDELVKGFQRINSSRLWQIAGYLGVHTLLVEAIVDRINEMKSGPTEVSEGKSASEQS